MDVKKVKVLSEDVTLASDNSRKENSSSTYPIYSLFEYVSKKKLIAEMIDSSTEKPFRRPAETKEEFENWSQEGTVKCPISRIYTSVVHNAYIRSCMDGIVAEGKYLIDRIEWDFEGIALFPPDSALSMDSKSIVLKKAENRKKIEKGIFLIKEFTPNIFHFTIEAICRLDYIDRLEKYDDWPLLLDANGRKDKRTLQLIEVMNDHHHPIIWIEKNEEAEVSELLVPPVLAWAARGLEWRNKKRFGIIVDSSVQEIMRRHVLEQYYPKKVYDKVYVERGNNNRLVNEDEVKEYLKKNGFEIFNPDKGDFWNEVDCFATANTIVTVAGGAMTNVLYSKKDAQIMEICPLEHQSVAYTFLIETMGLTNMKMIDAHNICLNSSINRSTFFLDMEQCEKIVKMSEQE